MLLSGSLVSFNCVGWTGSGRATTIETQQDQKVARPFRACASFTVVPKCAKKKEAPGEYVRGAGLPPVASPRPTTTAFHSISGPRPPCWCGPVPVPATASNSPLAASSVAHRLDLSPGLLPELRCVGGNDTPRVTASHSALHALEFLPQFHQPCITVWHWQPVVPHHFISDTYLLCRTWMRHRPEAS